LLLPAYGPLLTPPFDEPALRLQPDGEFRAATLPDDIGLLFRPIVTQISRWDRLKGFRPLLEGFVLLKKTLRQRLERHGGREPRALELARLVLAGPEPAAIKDDPEGQEVFQDLCKIYSELEPEVQADVVLLSLPMSSRKNNALMVNALQRCSTVVVQNSLREGFGLTATEAMWKRIAVLASSACGLRQQIRHGIDGHLLPDPLDVSNIADVLEELLTHPHVRENYARTAQRRVHDDFLIFIQLRHWLRVLAGAVDRRHSARPGPL
jgi:trehalose synthase